MLGGGTCSNLITVRDVTFRVCRLLRTHGLDQRRCTAVPVDRISVRMIQHDILARMSRNPHEHVSALDIGLEVGKETSCTEKRPAELAFHKLGKRLVRFSSGFLTSTQHSVHAGVDHRWIAKLVLDS